MFFSLHVQKLKFIPALLCVHIKTTLEGAQTTVYCAVSEEMEGVTGQYLDDCKITKLETLKPLMMTLQRSSGKSVLNSTKQIKAYCISIIYIYSYAPVNNIPDYPTPALYRGIDR